MVQFICSTTLQVDWNLSNHGDCVSSVCSRPQQVQCSVDVKVVQGLSSGVACFASALLSGEYRQHSFEKENQGILHPDFSPVFLFWSVVVLVLYTKVYILIQKRVIAF